MTLRVDWAIMDYRDRWVVRSVIQFCGVSQLDMPTHWESVYDWGLTSDKPGEYILRLTENHEGRPIQVAFASLEEISASRITYEDLEKIPCNRTSPHGSILVSPA